jgi:hypothetical protein
MLERMEPWFKMLCLLAAALLFFQIARLAGGKDPLQNVTVPAVLAATNHPAKLENAPQTNSAPVSPSAGAPPGAMPRPGGPPRPGAPPRAPDLPPAVQARVDRVRDSEIFGPVQRPLPMALIALGGHEALIRSASGPTTWMKEGDELGGIKLLRIGTNRVLVEHEGQQKELMIFAGFGGETLLQKRKAEVP